MDSDERKQNNSKGVAWPVAHILALAPIDVWVRLLARSGGIAPRYWARVGFIFVTSLVGTLCTVHERVILRLIHGRRFGEQSRIAHEPGAVVILGYYRSGTTHLQNLMSCDERFVSPRWYQCLAGQGFVFGWSLIRFVLVPFLGGTRPQDAVGFGPNWPAEDDFALCSWGMCSSIPGRFVFPSGWEEWKRWHGLDGLSEQELNRWRSLTAMFVWKLTRGKRNRARVVLLKTPSHTARVAELDRLFNGHVKFVHLVREPGAVIDSNVRLHDALKDHLLEDAPDVQVVRERIVEEYAYTEAKCCDELESIENDRVVRIRYQDLRADGIGTLKSVYETLGLGWDDETERSIERYMGSLGEYSSVKEPIELGAATEQEEMMKAEMVSRYGLDAPAVEAREVAVGDVFSAKPGRGMAMAGFVAILCALVWVGVVWGIHWIDPMMRMRLVPAVWICGALIGLSARSASGVGTRGVGIVAAVLTVLVVIGVAFPVTVINWNWAADDGTRAWLYHNAKGGYQGLRSVASVVFIVLGAMTAYRHGSWSGPTAPGESGKIRV